MRTRVEIKDLLRPLFEQGYSSESTARVAAILTEARQGGWSTEDLAELSVEALTEARPAEALAFSLKRGCTPKEAMRRDMGFDRPN